MMPSQMDQTIDLFRKVRKIEIKAKGLSEQVFSGQYHSAFRGQGMAFSEVRGYQVGDDIRSIDWNVTARHATPYVKVFEEERELTVMLLVDLTGSTMYGTHWESKRELMTEVAAVLAFSAMENHDRVGAIFFSDCIELFIPPKSGRKHILYIIRELLSFTPKNKGTDLTAPLYYLVRAIKRRCTAFLISDLIQESTTYKDTLAIASRKHDLMTIRVSDPGESILPNLGLMQIQDSETGEKRWIDSSSRKNRLAYQSAYQKQLSANVEICARCAVDVAHIQSGVDYIPELIKLFRCRR